MYLIIGAVLVVIWVLGFLAFHIAGALIHLLLLAAVVVVIWHFVSKRGAG